MSFKSVQKKIAGQGHSMASAGAILANASRHASPAAKRANPKLSRVAGKFHLSLNAWVRSADAGF